MNETEIAGAVQLACLLEVSAPKPGNVSPLFGFADARFEHYLASAVAIGPPMAPAGSQSVGATIRAAVRDTRRYVASNVNLGIILLLAPLAKAAAAGGRPLRESLTAVLAALTVQDAVDAYAAIREASPGGLGEAPSQDLRQEPTVTLREAMALAADRDTIAREYVTDFAITFGETAPTLLAARRSGLGWPDAIVQTYLQLLAQVEDTLIARKLGRGAAQEVSRAASEVVGLGGVRTDEGRRAIVEFDRTLRDPKNERNPGTTADMIAAATFVVLTECGEPL